MGFYVKLNEAISDDWIPDNPASHVRIRPIEKKRKHMTLEQFNAIRGEAKPWMQNAMDIGLITLQRRTDILLMQFADIEDGYLKAIQQKTKKKTDAAYIKLKVTAGLAEVIKRCRDRVHSPLLIHDKPHRGTRKSAKKIHWTQISPTKFTVEFDRARQATGLFDDAEKGTVPTFHEIRALGIKLYRDQGSDPQALAGHTSPEMTNHYDSEHDEIRWTVVDTDLKLSN
ncbi:MAG: tyrosine-type recombinase/integrase [Marinobacterium sp.]|nr:tyrosine-type recombinase/integrase [Marinobacterium sp.]